MNTIFEWINNYTFKTETHARKDILLYIIYRLNLDILTYLNKYKYKYNIMQGKNSIHDYYHLNSDFDIHPPSEFYFEIRINDDITCWIATSMLRCAIVDKNQIVDFINNEFPNLYLNKKSLLN